MSTSIRASSPTCHRRRPRRHRRLRRRRRLRRAQQRRRHASRPAQLVLADFGYEAGGWRVDKHPRFLRRPHRRRPGRHRRLRRRRRVRRARATATARSSRRSSSIADFGYDAGGWRVDKHPRFLADITGDGRGRHRRLRRRRRVRRAQQRRRHLPGAAVRASPTSATTQRLARRHSTRASSADLTGDGRADIVGFGDAGVWTARRATATAPSSRPQLVLADFGYEAGGWRVDKHPRFLADVTGDGRADIVGFGDAGVYVALSNGDGTFQPAQLVRRRLRLRRRRLAGRQASALPRRPRRGDGAPTSSASATRACTSRSPTVTARSKRRASCCRISATKRRARAGARRPGSAATPGFGARATVAARGCSCIRFPARPATQTAARCGRASLGAGDCELRLRGGRDSARGEPRRRRDVPERDAHGAGRLPVGNHVAVAATPPGASRRRWSMHSSTADVRLVRRRRDLDRGPGTLPARIGGAVGLFNSPAANVLVVSPRSPLEVFVTANEVGSATQSPASFAATTSSSSARRHRCGVGARCRISASSSAARASSRRRSPDTATCSSTARNARRHSSRRSIPEHPRTGTRSTWPARPRRTCTACTCRPISRRRSRTARTSTAGTVWMTSDGGVRTEP